MITTLMAAQVFAASPMIKFELVDNTGDTPTEVKLSFPIGIVEAMRPAFEDAVNEIDVDGHDIDFRAIWEEVRNAGPNEYVDVTTEEANVRVATTDTQLVIDVEGLDGEEVQNVKVTVPLSLGDFLFGGEVVDFDGIIDELASMQGQTLVTIEGDITGRLYID